MNDIVERGRFLAARQYGPHSMTITELCDKIEGLEEDLKSAVEVAWHRGATEWVQLNYPRDAERLERDR